MKRLTVKGPSGLITLNDKSENGANQAIKCLFEYEDAGLDPEQIRELKDRNTAKAPEPAPLGMEGMVCPTCGCKAVPWAKFCDECGQKFVED